MNIDAFIVIKNKINFIFLVNYPILCYVISNSKM